MVYKHKTVCHLFLLAREALEQILSFGCPISFLRLRMTSKQGDVIYSCTPKVVKETWVFKWNMIDEKHVYGDNWWLGVYGLILLLQDKDNSEWEANECQMMYCLLYGIWIWWDLSEEFDNLLLKIFHDVRPPKYLLGRIILKSYRQMYLEQQIINQKFDLLDYFMKMNPEISIRDALIVSGADVRTCCNGLYIARKSQPSSDIRVYDLWSHLHVPLRSMITYGNGKRFGCYSRIVGTDTQRGSRISEMFKNLDHNGSIWIQSFPDVMHNKSQMRVEEVTPFWIQQKMKKILLCVSLSPENGFELFPQWHGVEEAE